MESVPTMLGAIASAGASYMLGKTGAREDLLEALRTLVAALELPSEFLQRTGWAQPAGHAAMRTFVDLDMFARLSARPEGQTVPELARQAGIDEELLRAPRPLGLLLRGDQG